MSSLTISIDPDVFKIFPDTFVLAMRAEGLDAGISAALAATELTRGVNAARDALAGLSTVTDHPIIAAWRKAYVAMGIKPSKYRSSIEALLRRALRDGADKLAILPLVDVYNGCSLNAIAPLGAADLDLLPSTAIKLRHARPCEDSFVPLGGQPKDFPLTEKAVVYAAGAVVLCWAMNCRDSKVTALRPETARAVFISEGITAEHRAASEAAISRLGFILTEAGVLVNATSVDAAKPDVVL